MTRRKELWQAREKTGGASCTGAVAQRAERTGASLMRPLKRFHTEGCTRNYSAAINV